MATNKFPGACKECGWNVPTGKGILTCEWSNYKDDTEWVVRHADKSICKQAIAADKNDGDCRETIAAVINYIKSYGTKSAITDGSETLYDGRKGYNFVGWLVTRDDDNTIYMTSRSNSDGYDLSETYIMTDNGDDGYGNSNTDIITTLRNAQAGEPAANLKAFAA